MTNAERIKLVKEQADFVQREADLLRSLKPAGPELRLRPDGVLQIADVLATASKNLLDVASDMEKDDEQ